jgi:hypothetical protein
MTSPLSEEHQKSEERTPATLVKLNLGPLGSVLVAAPATAFFRAQGKDYPLAISGINIADVGVSQFQGAGKVYDLKNGADFSVAMPPRRLRLQCGQSSLSVRNEC